MISLETLRAMIQQRLPQIENPHLIVNKETIPTTADKSTLKDLHLENEQEIVVAVPKSVLSLSTQHS
jgi:hypothetical protein